MFQIISSYADGPTNSVEYSSKNMDHPGIVAMVCREIDLAGEIDRIVGVDPRQKVTCGEVVVAMVLNNDTTTMSLQGEYKHEEGDLDAVPIEITYGFSKDHRPDLKQFVISLVMSDDLPVFIQALSGNASDKNHFREIVKEYGASLRGMRGEDKIWVWDSAVYSEKNLREISESYKWVTRVPETLSEAKEVLENAGKEDREGERAGGERGMAVLQSGIRLYGGWTEGCAEEGKAMEIPQNKLNRG